MTAIRPLGRWLLSLALGGGVLVATTAPALAVPDPVLTPEQQRWLDDRDRTIVLGADDTFPTLVFFEGGEHREGIANVRVAGTISPAPEHRLGVRSDRPILRDIIDAGLSTISRGERNVIERRWIELGPSEQPVSGAVLWIVGLAAFVAGLLAIGVLAWNRALRRRVDRSTEDLRRGLEAHERTKTEQSRLELAISQAVELVVVADADWSVRYVNPTYERVTGRSATDRLGRPLDELFTTAADRDTLDDVRGALEQGVWRGRLALRGSDGAAIPVEGSIASLTLPSGEPGGFVGTLRDATEEQRLRDELQRSERLRAVGTLAAGIAHDFNNLLTPILGSAELIAVTDDDAQRARYVQAIRVAGRRAADLVEQVRSFGLEEEIENEHFDLRSVVTEAVDLIRHACPDDIVVECQLADEPLVICADPSKFHQLVMNLLTNAVQAMEDGGGRLRVELNDSRASSGESPAMPSSGRNAILVVADTGVGIDDAAHLRLFEPYFSTRKAAGGTGLGLFTVVGIVHSLGGHIDVTSQPGAGSTVQVVVPITDDRLAPEAPADELPPTAGGARILVVDDDAIVLDVLESILEQLGHDVTACPSGRSALESFDSEEHFDLLLTDLGMPDMRGDALAVQIRQRCPGIPIVMLTGLYDTEALDPDWSVLTKPISVSTLHDAIQRALGPASGEPRGTAALAPPATS